MTQGPGSQARTGPRGRGRDPLGQGPGPGPLGPGAWGPLGPRCRIRVATVTTYCQAGYLLSGKLPAVRQSYLQSGKLPTVRQSYLQSGKATYSQAKLPTVRQSYLQSGKAPNRAIDMQPKAAYMHPEGIDMHPKVSIYFAPNFRILCTQPSHRHAPKRHRCCTRK